MRNQCTKKDILIDYTGWLDQRCTRKSVKAFMVPQGWAQIILGLEHNWMDGFNMCQKGGKHATKRKKFSIC